jgi:hypothetical protein
LRFLINCRRNFRNNKHNKEKGGKKSTSEGPILEQILPSTRSIPRGVDPTPEEVEDMEIELDE